MINKRTILECEHEAIDGILSVLHMNDSVEIERKLFYILGVNNMATALLEKNNRQVQEDREDTEKHSKIE